MSANTSFSKHMTVNHGVQLYKDNKEMERDHVNHETIVHNNIASSQVSRRKKIRVCGDDMLARKNKVRERLLKKLAERKAKK